jgi:LPXTG-site transpeptidase (sortase) family protein
MTTTRVSTKRRIIRIVLEFVLAFIILFTAGFIYANFSAIQSKLSFWWAERFGDEPQLTREVDGLGEFTDVLPPDDRIVIPRLGVNAPLLFPPSAETDALLLELQNGVIHYPGTALPGQRGNVFITGHSSQLAWEKGDYKSVFALLEKLKEGDTIVIYFQKTKYVYRVEQTKVVAADDLSILEPTDDHRVTIMTCWPVGTIARRMVVTARQETPEPQGDDGPRGDTQLWRDALPASLPEIR